MAWIARRDHCHLHDAAVLRWTEPSLPADGTAFLPSGLTEAVACDIGAAAVHTGRRGTGDRHAQQLVCCQRHRHVMVYVCRLSSSDTDDACQSSQLGLLLHMMCCLIAGLHFQD